MQIKFRNCYFLFDIDVFISHSHADEDEAIRIALSMEKIGLKAFVDSCVWVHADELLKKLTINFVSQRAGITTVTACVTEQRRMCT